MKYIFQLANIVRRKKTKNKKQRKKIKEVLKLNGVMKKFVYIYSFYWIIKNYFLHNLERDQATYSCKCLIL